ncbi:aldehyde dehydrogenase family protein [Sporichthya brevicatena]|uniref:aldehyde dehydrogenase (NAD(+)) n=1 Tax=Sporichthya brevicatena TaxID=171442 RepID=A0ABN1GC77_9ACTN
MDEIQVISPVDGSVVAAVAETEPAGVRTTVAAARAAAPAWGDVPVADRAAILDRWAQAVLDAGDEIAAVTSAEMGMPLALARVTQVELVAAVLQNTAAAARDFPWLQKHDGFEVHHVPAGVVAAITPWNFPVYQCATKLAPALAAGCAVVLKPSELAPTGPTRFVELAIAAGVPAAVFGLVHGRGPTVGETLVTADGVDVVSFTGSVAVGSKVGALAGAAIRRVALELGGKSAAVVLDDVDLDEVIPRAVRAAFVNSGQACNAPTRLLYPRASADRVEALAAAAASALRVGDPSDPATDLGPLVSAAQYERVRGFVDRAMAAGARPLGPVAELAPPYCAPVVLADVERDAEVAREEVFGPVLVLLPYDDDADAIAVANDTDYGLSAEIWGADPARIAAIAARLRAGQVKVNGVRTRTRPGAPFGGFGKSGVGRELGEWGLLEFCEVKAVLA